MFKALLSKQFKINLIYFNNYEKVVQVVNNQMMLVTIKLCNTELLKVKVHSEDRVSVFSGFIC